MINYEFEMAWASIYNTFDEAFDYRGKPLFVNDAALIWNGSTFDEYWTAPF